MIPSEPTLELIGPIGRIGQVVVAALLALAIPLACAAADPATAELHREARAAADAVVSTLDLPPGCGLEFKTIVDKGAELHVVYDKTFPEPTKESPSTVTVAVDKQTKDARLVLRE